ncbi:DUF6302 family protein [Streptomyces sp. NPDC001165]|uniref:DUF6302 family protein n=1 Tax=Streptomyces sp. NPDC001165 TaxID=3364546 RepID=UPI0036BC047D
MRQRPRAAVKVRPADQRDEWEASWYRERLLDPKLLDTGIVVAVDHIGYLAVPVGGQRHGGSISAADRATARSLRDALTGRPGFPQVRVRWSTCPSVCHVVEWGDKSPDIDDDTVRGRFYGYSDRAIAAFADELAHLGQ